MTAVPDVPRDRLSEAAARVQAKRTAYEAHLARARRSRWRLGLRNGYWQIARLGPDTGGEWVVLDEQLQAFPDIDPGAERKRVSSWVRETLEVRSVWRYRDYRAEQQGREAYDLEIKS